MVQDCARPVGSIGRWILYRLTLLLLILGVLFFALSVYLLDKRFDTFDAEYYRQELARVSVAFEQERRSMASMIGDYARWDDAERFVAGKLPDFIEANFTVDSMKNIRMTTFVISSIAGVPISSKTFNSQGALVDTPKPVLEELQPWFAEVIRNGVDDTSTSLLWIDGRAVLLSAAPITDTARRRAASGYMFFLRSLDDTYLAGLRKTTSSPFSLNEAPASASTTISVKHDTSGSEEGWTVTQTLQDSPAIITVGGPTRLGEERKLTYMTVGMNALVLVMVALAGIYMILNLHVLRRLKRFSGLADRHQKEGGNGIRWPIQGNDEFDSLARSLNGLMTEVESQNGNLRHLADHDPLTGIGNRRLILARLEAVQNRGQHGVGGGGSSLLLIDLDGFKLINDGLGHAAGDHVLREVAARIVSLVRRYDTPARIGGDEFTILLEDVSVAEAMRFAKRLALSLEEPILFEEHALRVSASGGVSSVGVTLAPAEVLRNADLAMYEAKRRGKAQFATFDISMLDAAARKMQLELALKVALDRRDLDVWFQPIVEANSGRAVGMEALARWSLDGNFVPPGEFVAIAEDTGLIVRLGQFVFDQVGEAMQGLCRLYPELQCSVNLSVAQFHRTGLVKDIRETFDRYSVPASAVRLELTESMLVEAGSAIVPVMRELIGLGYHFHLDDFGTGYSSLDRLRNLPFHSLKIDRSFIVGLCAGNDVMARNIANIGKELGMEIIAEGVEQPEELEQLRQIGCDFIQGFYFAKPMPLDDLYPWLANNQRLSEKQKSA
ncbi:MAG: bifunctional diguanylate cyclase/phosphodiesterase [Betaproteobacteria bacterium HGW-Betaproteobacteria-13]|nr:MAG: bifunctional diguanylate cyclase/phosphodiesterase [Gammaproteobacteria bacterium HGW-Gammaproteobacteria-8]PKO82255.1 MAG: bifunctional diguanylate cyclase/phosphodiesterase [Betaproteobacteria bacterium HGW-Betaproteobacteria-13]